MNRSEETVEVFFRNTDNPAPFRLESRDFLAKSAAVCRLQGNNDRLTAPAGHAPLHLVGMKKIPDGFGSIQVANIINFSQEIKEFQTTYLLIAVHLQSKNNAAGEPCGVKNKYFAKDSQI